MVEPPSPTSTSVCQIVKKTVVKLLPIRLHYLSLRIITLYKAEFSEIVNFTFAIQKYYSKLD